MVRPAIDLEPYKAQIIHLYQDGRTTTAISTFLQRQCDVQVHPHTVNSRLQGWGIETKHLRTAQGDPVIKERIKELFFQIGLEDTELLKVLQSEGFKINARTLQRVRTELGLVQRTDNPDKQHVQQEQALKGLLKEIEAGTIEGYGKEMLHRHMRRAGYIVPRFAKDSPFIDCT